MREPNRFLVRGGVLEEVECGVRNFKPNFGQHSIITIVNVNEVNNLAREAFSLRIALNVDCLSSEPLTSGSYGLNFH